MGLDLARADIVVRMDGDDICELTRFEDQYRYLLKNKDIDIVGSFVTLIDHNGKKTGEKKKPLDYKSIKKDAFLYSPLVHPAVMFRKKAVLELGKYDEQYSYCQDYDLWLRAIYSGYKASNIPKFLLKYRIHENSSSKSIRLIARNDFIIRKNAIKKYNLKLSVQQLFFMYIHFILGIIISGRQKQKFENLYKKMLHEKYN